MHDHKPHIGFELQYLRDGEKVEMIIRRHWITLVYLGFYVVFLLGSTGALLMIRSSLPGFLGGELFYLMLIIYWAFFSLFLYIFWINNELDFLIVTNQRAIGLEQRTFLDRNIAECSIDRIQEVDARTTGLLSNLLDFGKLTIHTASQGSHFILEYAPNPLENARHILNITHDHRGTIASSAISK